MINDIKQLLKEADSLVSSYIGKLHKQLHLAESDYMYRKIDKATFIKLDSSIRREIHKLSDLSYNVDKGRYIAEHIDGKVGYGEQR